MTQANGLTTVITRCICGHLFLKIHQAQMKCLNKETQVQHTGLVPGEMQEEHGLDSPHRAQYLLASVPQTTPRVVQQRIKWPPAASKSIWQQFNEDVCEIVQTTAKGDADRRLHTMATSLLAMCLRDLAL